MAIAFGVASHSLSAGGGSTTIATQAAVLTAGYTNFVEFRGGSSGGRIDTVTDTAGNKYHRISRASGSSVTHELWAAFNCTGNASNIVTGTFSASQSFRGAVTASFSGLGSLPAIRCVDNASASSSTTVTSGKMNSIGADYLIIVSAQTNNTGQTWTPPSGFTQADQDQDAISTMFYKIETAIATDTTYTATSTGAQDKAMNTAFIEAASSGGGGGEPFAASMG